MIRQRKLTVGGILLDFKAVLSIVGLFFFLFIPDKVFCYTETEICDIIYIIEGKEKARQPFGIETIECITYEKCEQICHNTVRNNMFRFKKQDKEKDFLLFLAKRYCPPNYQVWVKNLKFYLEKEK